jgi:hypothetical protein
VVTGSKMSKFGQACHTEYASGKADLQYGLVRRVKNEIVRLNSQASINAVAPGLIDTLLIEGRMDDPKEMWTEGQTTIPLQKISQSKDIARAMAFLASHRATGNTGECLSIEEEWRGGSYGKLKKLFLTPSVPLRVQARPLRSWIKRVHIFCPEPRFRLHNPFLGKAPFKFSFP